MPVSDTPSLPDVDQQLLSKAAESFQKGAAAREAIPGEQLSKSYFSIADVVRLCLATAERVSPFTPAILTLPGVRAERLELQPAALGLWHAWVAYQYASSDGDRYDALIKEGTPLRDTMLFEWGWPLVSWGVLTADELALLQDGRGHDDLAADLSFAGPRVVSRWNLVEGKVPFTRADAERAGVIGTEIHTARNEKEGKATTKKALKDLLAQFSLVALSIEEWRAGLGWLRRDEKDIDVLAPSIYTVRNRGAKKVAPAEPQAPAA